VSQFVPTNQPKTISTNQFRTLSQIQFHTLNPTLVQCFLGNEQLTTTLSNKFAHTITDSTFRELKHCFIQIDQLIAA